MSSHFEGKLEPRAGSCGPGPGQGRRGGEECQLLLLEHGSDFLQTFQVAVFPLQLFPEIHVQVGCVPFASKFTIESLRWCNSHLPTQGIIASDLPSHSPHIPVSNRNSQFSVWLSHDSHIMKGNAR